MPNDLNIILKILSISQKQSPSQCQGSTEQHIKATLCIIKTPFPFQCDGDVVNIMIPVMHIQL